MQKNVKLHFFVDGQIAPFRVGADRRSTNAISFAFSNISEHFCQLFSGSQLWLTPHQKTNGKIDTCSENCTFSYTKPMEFVRKVKNLIEFHKKYTKYQKT